MQRQTKDILCADALLRDGVYVLIYHGKAVSSGDTVVASTSCVSDRCIGGKARR
jgi:hypothetical protein